MGSKRHANLRDFGTSRHSHAPTIRRQLPGATRPHAPLQPHKLNPMKLPESKINKRQRYRVASRGASAPLVMMPRAKLAPGANPPAGPTQVGKSKHHAPLASLSSRCTQFQDCCSSPTAVTRKHIDVAGAHPVLVTRISVCVHIRPASCHVFTAFICKAGRPAHVQTLLQLCAMLASDAYQELVAASFPPVTHLNTC
jgi:hypothetical protein